MIILFLLFVRQDILFFSNMGDNWEGKIKMYYLNTKGLVGNK